MLYTLFMIGLMAFAGLIVLKLAFGLFAGLLGVMFVLLGFAVKVLIVGAIAYLAIRIVSPSTARRIRDKFSGTPSTY